MASAFSRAQFTNFAAYHALVSLVNVLNLPLPQGTFFSKRGARLTVLDRDVHRLRMLKSELDPTDESAVRGYLVAAKALLFDIGFLLHQEPGLARNEAFFSDHDRLTTLLAGAASLSDIEEIRDLAFKLSVMLPFYDDADAMKERNARAEEWFAASGSGPAPRE